MASIHTVWVSSYPRSGNTLLRTILWHCFGYRSGSLYLNDMGNNSKLEDYVGHIERNASRELVFPPNSIPFVKTHETKADDSPAIYVVRDGRAVVVSLWRFLDQKYSLQEIINGECHQYGTWANHLAAWNPWERADTLLLRYEDMTANLPDVLNRISEFFGCRMLRSGIPERDAIASVSKKIVRPESDWREALQGAPMERFLDINGEMMSKAGYLD